MNVNIAQLVAEGKTADQIKDIVAVEIAKAEAAKTPTLQEIGARVANGEMTTKDLIVIALGYITDKIPEIADLGELEITGADLTDLAEAIDAAIEEGRDQIKSLLTLADMMGVDPKEMITSQVKGVKPGSISTSDAEAILASLKQSFKPNKF